MRHLAGPQRLGPDDHAEVDHGPGRPADRLDHGQRQRGHQRADAQDRPPRRRLTCPEERAIFASLSTEENLTLAPVVASGGMSVEEIYEMFPNLKERRNSPGTKLSGGEQQMLAMARILRTGAKLLLLDEITEGLAPVIVKKLGEVITELKQRGFTIVLVEQNFRFAAPLADRHYVLEHGEIIATITQEELPGKMDWLHHTLGV
jgi:branched-chain amino acid transport system ATP-binding protein